MLIFYVFTLIALGLSQEEEDLLLSNDDTSSTNITNDYATYFANIDFLTFGYDIYEGFPFTTAGLDPGFQLARLFDFEDSYTTTADRRYYVPEGTSAAKLEACSLSFDSQEVSSEQRLQNQLSAKASVSGSYLVGSFRMSGEYQQLTKDSFQSNSTNVFTTGECQVYKAWIDEYHPPKLSLEFLRHVNEFLNPEAIIDVENIINFYDVFGTHYVSSLTMGARLTIIKTLNRAKKINFERSGTSIAAAARYSALVSFSAEMTYNNQVESAQEFEKIVASTRTSTIGSRPPLNGDAEAWAQQAFEDPMPLSYSLTSLEGLFNSKFINPSDLEFSPNFDDIKYRLREGFKEYCFRKALASTSESSICTLPPPGEGDVDIFTFDETKVWPPVQEWPDVPYERTYVATLNRNIYLFNPIQDEMKIAIYHTVENLWTVQNDQQYHWTDDSPIKIVSSSRAIYIMTVNPETKTFQMFIYDGGVGAFQRSAAVINDNIDWTDPACSLTWQLSIINDTLYSFGGCGGNWGVWRLDEEQSSETWTRVWTGSYFVNENCSLQSAVISDTLYIYVPCENQPYPEPLIQAFNITNMTFDLLISVPQFSEEHTMVAAGGYLYFLNPGNMTDDILIVLDPITRKFATPDVSHFDQLKNQLVGQGEINNRLYVIFTLNDIYPYLAYSTFDLKHNDWTTNKQIFGDYFRGHHHRSPQNELIVLHSVTLDGTLYVIYEYSGRVQILGTKI